MVAFRLSSENQLGREFELTRRKICVDATDQAAVRGIDAGAWIARIDVVKRVESVHSELSAEALADRNALRYRDICIPLARSPEGVATGIPNVTNRWDRKWAECNRRRSLCRCSEF